MQRATRPAGYADLHVHTCFSDGRHTPREVIDRARGLPWLDVIAITDHDEIRGAEEAFEYSAMAGGPEVIVGEEVSSRDGHILALFINELVPPGLPAGETVEAIHEQGGMAIAAHPFWRHNPAAGFSYGVGGLARELPFDGIEVLNGGFTPSMIVANRRAARLAAGSGLAQTGGSDAHVRDAVGWARTAFEGSSAAELRYALLQAATQPSSGPIAVGALTGYAIWSLGRLRAVEAAS